MPENGKKLSELRVCDLKDELDRRELETVGTKAALLERLQSALKSEGIDPSTYVYLPTPKSAKKASPAKIADDEDVLIKEEPTDFDNSGIDDDANGTYDNDHLIDEVGTVDDECVLIEDDDDYYANGDEQAEEEEENEEENDENNGEVDGNNPDNEESINLTIGEEEQKLLHDEAPDDKEKPTDIPAKKGVRKESEDKSAGKENKSDNTGKDENKGGKDEDGANKNKSKNDEKSSDKKDDSEQKSTSKTVHKEDKEKSTAASSNTAATNAAGDASKSAAGSKSTTPSRNLWVSGLSSLTRASDLKMIFTKYGKVIGAKVVTNTRTPGTRCYGYVTMSSSNDASRCIEHLHRTELHGRIISVERTKNEIGGSASSNTGNRSTGNTNSSAKKREDDKKTSRTSSDDKKKGDDHKKSSTHSSKKDDSKKDDKSKKDEKEKTDSKTETKEAGKEDKDRSETSSIKRQSRRGSRSAERARPDRGRDHDRDREQRQKERERERERIRQREILSYQKIREERERQRLREKERELRKEDVRRREIRERQRLEEQRLAEERKKLALERERLEKEKAELLRLERERQKLEREKIELERLELKRQQMKIITQSRDDPIKRPAKRSGDERYTDVPDRKRSAGNDSRFEAPPPPRFDAALVPSRSYDKKRDDYTSSTTTKRGIDDYSTSKRTDYSSKRDDYTGSNTKRAAVDDYTPAPPKRSTDDYSKRTTGDYISSSSSKRAIDDYSSTSKRDDYSSSKIRDDYKREVEIRHVPSASIAVSSSSYIHKSSGSRYAEPDIQVRSSVTSFRRIDDRSDNRAGNKRYDTSNSYGNSSNNNVWGPQSNSSHMGHSSSGVPSMKSYVSNGMSSNLHSGGSALWPKSSVVADSNWRSMTSTQDRYDRTYNERSGGYIDSSRQSGNMYGGGGRPSDRYGDASSRYTGKY